MNMWILQYTFQKKKKKKSNNGKICKYTKIYLLIIATNFKLSVLNLLRYLLKNLEREA